VCICICIRRYIYVCITLSIHYIVTAGSEQRDRGGPQICFFCFFGGRRQTSAPRRLSYSLDVRTFTCIICESTAAEAVDDMQRMNVADRMKNGKRPPHAAAARPTQRGRTKADHHTEGHTKRPTGGRRGTHTGNTQTHNPTWKEMLFLSYHTTHTTQAERLSTILVTSSLDVRTCAYPTWKEVLFFSYHIQKKTPKTVCGSWGPVSMWMCVLSSALICNALAWRCSRRRGNNSHNASWTPLNPTCWIGIHVFLGRNHTNTNTVFGLENPVYNMKPYVFKVTVFIKQAQYE